MDGTVQLVVDVVSAVELAVCTAVTALLVARWRRHRAPATAAALGVFGALSLVIASGRVAVEDVDSGLGLLWTKAVVVLLLGLPYLVVVLARALGAVSPRVHLVLAGVYAAEVVVTLAIPPLPGPDSTERPGWVLAYTAAVVLAWTVQTAVAAHGLWRAGRHESSVVRHRMRSLSAGAVAMAVAIVLMGVAGNAQPVGVQLTVLAVGLVSIALFALAFLLPPSLRVVWRRADLSALGEAERGLMTALRGRDVAATIEPVLSGVLGGVVVLLDSDRRPLRAERRDEPAVAAVVAQLTDDRSSRRGPVREVAPGTLAVRLDRGWLVAQGGRLAPVFGDDEASLLDRVATLVDLALQRVQAFEQEAASRRAAEAANAELETLLHSVSHDLRSPLISVLGYLEVLRTEHAAELTGDGPHYLERLGVNAVYMQALISDLLELSRIGRADPPSVVVDLQALAEQVAESAALRAPRADVRLQGALPRLVASDVRLRQLLTNLVDNAVAHSGRDDVTVTVAATATADGGVVLEVRDDGRGIPPEYRTRVLRVFERLGPPGSSPGTGMGLAICKRIAETLGGTLVVDGPPPGVPSGTTVRVGLPASLRAGQPADRPAGATAVPAPRPPAVVLPVEETV